MVVFNSHKEDAIVSDRMVCLIQDSCGPVVAVVAPGPVVRFFSPWVSQLDKSLSIRESLDAED